LWRYATSFDAARALFMLALPDYGDVVHRIGTASVANCVWETFKSARLKGCRRISFLLQVPKSTYDAFFNSPVGYRAQYARGVEIGLAANRQLLDELEPALLGFAWSNDIPELDALMKSLHGSDAKVWIYEPDVESQLGQDAVEITYPPWQRNSESGVGLLAPLGTRLEVLGGWLDQTGHERRDPFKSDRALEIHLTGFS
jgi:hypothetical protein